MISVALYFLGQRGGALMVLVPLCAVGFGMAQYFVVMFKGTPIMPADLLSLRTAGAIAAGYEYALTPNMVIALCACGVCACVLSFVGSNKGELARKVRIAASVASAVVGIALFGVMAAMFDKVKLETGWKSPMTDGCLSPRIRRSDLCRRSSRSPRIFRFPSQRGTTGAPRFRR